MLYVVRGRILARQSTPEEDAPGIDREGTYRAGILLISLMSAGIAIGMSWPWFSALRTGTGAAIEERQYHMVIVWFFIPILILMGIGPFVSWRKMASKELFKRLVNILSVTAGLTGFALVAIQNPKIGVHLVPGATVAMPFHYRMSLLPWMAVLIFVCFFTAIANIWRIVEMVRKSPMGVGGFVAHLGIAVLMSGLIISRGFEQKDSGLVDQQDPPANILGYSIAFKKLIGVDKRIRPIETGRLCSRLRGPMGSTSRLTRGSTTTLAMTTFPLRWCGPMSRNIFRTTSIWR